MKKNIKLIIGICLVIVLIGVSFAWFVYYQEGDNHKIVAGNIFLALSNHGDSIVLENSFPETAEEARDRNDNYIDFTLTGVNTSPKDIYYQIELLEGDANGNKQRLDSKDLVFDLCTLNNQNEETIILDAVSYEDLNNHKIWVDYVEKGTNAEISKKFRLRMWLAQKIVYGEGYGAKYSIEDFTNSFASVKIAVNGNLEEKSFPLKYSYDDTNKRFLMTVWNDYFTRDDGIAADDNVVVRISNPENRLLFTYEDNNGTELYTNQQSLQIPYTFNINKIINGALTVSNIAKYGSDVKFEVLKNNIVVESFIRTVYDENSTDKGNLMSTITYNMPDGTTKTQDLYDGITNYLSELIDEEGFMGWSTKEGGPVEYQYGNILKFTSNKTLYPVINNIQTASEYLQERKSTQAACISTSPNKSSFYGDIDADVIYYTGNDESCLKNYVWYSGKLWRIVAIYPNGMMKLVTENNMTSIQFGSTVTFDGSWMDQWLSQEFLPTLYNKENIVVQNAEWNVKETTADTDPYLERVANDTINRTVGLLNAFEYTKSGASSSYLHIGQYWWLITPSSSSEVRFVFSVGSLRNNSPGSHALGARPSIYLKSNATFDTENYDGTRLSPFHIVGDVEEGKTNELLNTRISGEYVKFNNELYRIVGIENNTTKIVNTSYINNPNSSNTSDTTLGNFGSDVYFNTQSTDMKYWDKFLTDESGWLSTISSGDKNLLVNGTYYLGEYLHDTNYKATICKNTASELETTTISNCTKYEGSDTNKTYIGLVGLLRAGEMMSAQQSTLTHVSSSTTYKIMWLITPHISSSVRIVNNDGSLNYHLPSSDAYGVRPSINLKSETIILSGTGHVDDPYVVGLEGWSSTTPTPAATGAATATPSPSSNGELTITKIVNTARGTRSITYNGTFEFLIESTNGYSNVASLTVTRGSGSVTISGLASGDYTVTEINQSGFETPTGDNGVTKSLTLSNGESASITFSIVNQLVATPTPSPSSIPSVTPTPTPTPTPT